MVVLSLLTLLLLPIGSQGSNLAGSAALNGTSTNVTLSRSIPKTSSTKSIRLPTLTTVSKLATKISTSKSTLKTSKTTSKITTKNMTKKTTKTTVKTSTIKTTSSRKTSSTKTSTTKTSTTKTKTAKSLSTPAIPGSKAAATRPKGKRGLAYNDAPLTRLFGRNAGNANSQVSWAYNWYSSPCPDFPNTMSCGYNPSLQFVPMLYSADPYLLSIWPRAVEVALKNYGTRHLFSFNEPDGCFDGSSCMNFDVAVATHKKYMQPYAGRALIGTPAVTNAGAPHGLDWLKRFMAACDGCRFDFVNVHWYSNKYAGSAYFKSFIGEVRKVAAGRPIWVTEFALNNENAFTATENQQFLREVMSWMDSQKDVAAYAYFMTAKGMLVGPGGKAQSTLGRVYDNWWNGTTVGALPGK